MVKESDDISNVINKVLCCWQKLSALSASLARVVSTEDEEAEVDQFPVEGVRQLAQKIWFTIN